MSNLYHILIRHPAVEREEMYVELEELAARLVESGLLRIDAYQKVNFARFYRPYENINLTFTQRQLTDKRLLPKTRDMIAQVLSVNYHGKDLEHKTSSEIERLKDQFAKHEFVDLELEMKIARLLVQANHPIVIMLILLEQVEVYVSYSFNIGSVLDVVAWQSSGENGGMQSTDGRNAAVFVSCGGNPFGEPEEKNLEYGDGFPSMARLMIIAGQELGHYADMLRDSTGRHISRHSSNFSGTRAKDKMRKARLDDIDNTAKLEAGLIKSGLRKLFQIESQIKINRELKKKGIGAGLYFVYWKLYKWIFRRKCLMKRFKFIDKLPKDPYVAILLTKIIIDQKFNIAPKADVYRNKDPRIEEATACVEALARVPQQCNKWGHSLTSSFWPNMYRIYYKDVIESCIMSYEQMTGVKYRPKLTKPTVSLIYALKHLFKSKNRPLLHFVRF